MNNELNQHKKSDTIKWIITFVLLAVLLVGMACGIYVAVKNNKTNIQQEQPAPEVETSANNFVANAFYNGGIALATAEATTASSNEAVTISATLEHEFDDYITSIDWNIYFEDISTAWASGKDINDYVIMTIAEDEQSVIIECLKAFGEPIIIEARSVDNPECTATCQLDYVKRITKCTDFYINTDSTVGTSYKNYARLEMNNTVTAFYELSDGTINPIISISKLTFTLSNDFVNVINGCLPSTMQSRTSAVLNVTSNISSGGYVDGVFRFNTSAFYNGGGDNRKLNNRLYTDAFNAETGNGAPYCGGTAIITLDVKYEDTIYQQFEYYTNHNIPFERGALTYSSSVSSLTLDKDTVIL